MQIKNYKTNLSHILAECEANYWRLLKLLPEDRQFASYQVQLTGTQSAQISFSVQQQCAYTRMLQVVQKVHHLPWQWQLEVRVYQDAELAEVISCQKHRQVRPRYDYPNQTMHQPDEKYQQNRLLSEILSHCLKHGF